MHANEASASLAGTGSRGRREGPPRPLATHACLRTRDTTRGGRASPRIACGRRSAAAVWRTHSVPAALPLLPVPAHQSSPIHPTPPTQPWRATHSHRTRSKRRYAENAAGHRVNTQVREEKRRPRQRRQRPSPSPPSPLHRLLLLQLRSPQWLQHRRRLLLRWCPRQLRL
jgi:hypothetical protein